METGRGHFREKRNDPPKGRKCGSWSTSTMLHSRSLLGKTSTTTVLRAWDLCRQHYDEEIL